MMLATLFYNPVHIPSDVVLWMIIPLCAAVGIVYKTLKIKNLQQLPAAFGILMLYMLGGLVLLGVALWAIRQALL
jgi:hypothetical protein